ncbi:uncharacterized protein LOC119110198 [Pollicipes pollicipes]|uniref:uncharacterized protein LOC119110198 n=1 Tax=Pollicipes pollicipes TaxID=41117 RepID=UPI0018853DEA|nr:uncharacterized protein LOC119110198 [Pollicipes pollicipes]
MVYVHGESFDFGTGNAFDGSVLAGLGAVVVVTLNYRLGLLGFLNANFEPVRAVANYGLLDIVAALEFVRLTVSAFGGDPTSVTVFGHGAGAACINFLMTSASAPLGLLFHRVILMSGSSLAPWALLSGPLNATRQLARHTNYGIVISDEFFTNRASYVHRLTSYGLMTGVTSSDADHQLSERQLTSGVTPEQRDRLLRTYVQNSYSYHLNELLSVIGHEYTDWTRAQRQPRRLRDELVRALSDAQFVAPALHTASLFPDDRSTFFYVFGGHRGTSDLSEGSRLSYGGELPYVFGEPLVHRPGHLTGLWSAEDRALSEAAVTYWTNFAKSGDPNKPKDVFFGGDSGERYRKIIWSPYEHQYKKYMALGGTPRVLGHYRPRQVALWLDLLPGIHRRGGVAIGCSLLVLNILILAGVYYQREKGRVEWRRRAENGLPPGSRAPNRRSSVADARASGMALSLRVLLLLAPLGAAWAADRELACFYGSWARLRGGDGRVTVDRLEPSLCTSYIFAFALLDPATSALLHSRPDELLFYRQFTGLKRRNPRLRAELAVGGWNDSRKTDYAAMAADADRRRTFARSAAAALDTFGFDALHMDWEFPDGARQRRDFSALLEDLRAALGGRPLHVAVPASDYQARKAFEMGRVARLADRLYVMAYDMRGGWTPDVAGHHAPLAPRPSDFSQQDAKSAVRMWRAAGAPAEKLLLGIPLYGRGWRVAEPESSAPMPALGLAPAGPYTREPGVLSYLEICQNMQQRGWTSHKLVDEDFVYGAAAVGDGQWFGYDDEHMVAEKVRLALGLGLPGVFVWDVAMDDVRGLCSPRPFTLTNIIKQTLANETQSAEEDAPPGENLTIETQSVQKNVPPSKNAIRSTLKTMCQLPELSSDASEPVVIGDKP